MGRKVNMEKLMAKIAAVTQTDATELKEQAEKTKDLYSHDEAVMQKQAVINFFTTYIAPEEPRRQPNESKLKFAERLAEYHTKRNEWKFRVCDGCNSDFVYAYHYDGVRHCSLECLDTTLRKIGLQVTVGRDLKKRWGQSHPAIVPADALRTIRQTFGLSSEEPDADAPLSQPKSLAHCSEEHTQDTQPEQDNHQHNNPALASDVAS